MKNHIIVDSGSDLNKDLINSEDCTVTTVPINLQIEDKVYLDDDNFDQDAYLAAMEASAVAVKTAAPSPQLFMDAFKEGEHVFAVTLSSKLSATYQSAMTAKDMYFDEYGKKFIHVFDSLSASVGETAVALKVAELLKKGLGAGEVVEQVNQFIKGMRTYFIIDTFENLVKTGRIKPYVAKIASLLNVKPICGDENGEIKMVDKARGYTKALARLVKIIKESTPDIESRVISITHVKAYEKAVALKDALLEQVNAKDIIIHESNGATTTYGGRGGIVIAL
ncbi:MAG: DegV family protein [Defluviitaleaceae bacterium]|nr:DegV family protein [Defluviitaleaceae bacterium]